MSAKLFYLLNNHRCLALFTFLCLGLAIPDTADARLKIGLALSGGGARGAAHVGVLKELERLRIPIDYVAGTSVGAIIGGFYASGLNPVEIERIIIDSDLDSLFKDHQSRDNMSIRRKFDERLFQMDKDMGIKEGKLVLPSGLIQGQKLQLFLDKLLLDVAHIQDFDHLPIPFRAIVTDIVKGEAVALAKGNLPQAIRASMSLPSIFTTVKIDERILVDGGISNNMPVDIVKQMGADIVIAVDIGTPLLAEEKLGNLLGVSLQDLPEEAADKFNAAIQEYIDVQMFNADRPESLVNIASLYSRQNKPKQAEQFYNEAIAVAPYYTPAYVNLADHYRNSRNDDLGEKVLEDALLHVRDKAAIYHALGLLNVRQKQLDEAVEYLRLAAEAPTATDRYVYVYAIALNSTQKVKQALDVLQKAQQQYPSSRDILNALISINYEQGNNVQAQVYEKLLQRLLK